MKNEIKDIKKTGRELAQDDIVKFLKKKKRGVMIKTLNWSGPLRSRIWAFAAMLKGYFSFGEFCRLLLPLSFGEKLELMDRYDAFLCEELKKECHGSSDNSVNLFGHKFGGQNFYEVVRVINDVIISDQYHANKFLKKASVVIDAGAHIGVFSIFAANLALCSRIYSFEPVVKTFEFLKENTGYYPQITCVNYGLGNEVSQKNIFVGSIYPSGSVFEDSPFYSGKSDGRECESVNVSTIDAFVADNGIPHVDFIKMDTEGYEAKILKGARETIKKWKPVISMSAYHNSNDKEELPKIIKEICSDYVCELHHDREEDFICYVKK